MLPGAYVAQQPFGVDLCIIGHTWAHIGWTLCHLSCEADRHGLEALVTRCHVHGDGTWKVAGRSGNDCSCVLFSRVGANEAQVLGRRGVR